MKHKIVLLHTSMVSFDVFNNLFTEMIPEAKTSNVVVLAQGSMINLESYLKDKEVPVLTSPRLGVSKVKEVSKN